MGINMKKLILVLILALFTGLSFAGSQQIRNVMGMAKVQGGGPSYTSVFSDDFNRTDSGAVGGNWDSETDTASQLSIAGNTMLYTGTGVTTLAYVTENLVTNYYKYKVLFTFKINSLTVSANNRIRLLELRNAAGIISLLDLEATSGTINKLRTDIEKEDWTNVTTSTAYSFAADTEYAVEIIVSTATGADANDGTYEVKLNGSTVYSGTGLDTYSRHCSQIGRLGMGYTITGITNVLTFDSFDFQEGD